LPKLTQDLSANKLMELTSGKLKLPEEIARETTHLWMKYKETMQWYQIFSKAMLNGMFSVPSQFPFSRHSRWQRLGKSATCNQMEMTAFERKLLKSQGRVTETSLNF
jgi:hypothetical protein